jgi:hypothetical protein
VPRKLEDALDARTAELIALRKAAVEHSVTSPVKSEPLQTALGDWGSEARGTPSLSPAATNQTRRNAARQSST